MTTIREALEELVKRIDKEKSMHSWGEWGELTSARAALAAQPAQELTDEQISNMWAHECVNHHLTGELVNSFARAVERAHGIGGQP